MLAWPAPAFGAPDYAASKVLNAWLGAGMSSPLFMKVREEKGLAYEVASFYPSQKLGGSFIIYAGMDPSNLDAAQARALSVVDEAVKAPISADDLESAKRYIRGHFAMDHQTNGRQAWYMGFYELMGKGWAYDAQYPKDVQAVTAADVHAAAKKIFGRSPVIVRIRSKAKR
jgi:predicted Zn-dependent peptidase